MPLKAGIVGLPNVGKSTLFQALTKKEVDRSNYPFATIDPNVGVVEIPDERLVQLSKLSRSARTVKAVIEFVDIAGLVKGASQGEGLGNQFLSHIREVDAIVEVVRAFENPEITHVEGKPDPKRDISIIETELILKDLEILEKAVNKLEKESKTGEKNAIDRFEKIKKLIDELRSGKSAHSGEYAKFEKEFGLLSRKPILYCINAPEGTEIKEISPTVIFDLKQEFEIGELGEKEREELGVKSRLSELIQAAFRLLKIITFYTTGEDESRAWQIPENSKAPRAGRAIHSDFEEKFIKAEVIGIEKLFEVGGWQKARGQGKVRTEGKEYIVQDGDVIDFKI